MWPPLSGSSASSQTLDDGEATIFENPVLFPAISNRESFVQTIQIADDQTGELITLTDSSNNPLYAIYLEISPPRRGHSGGYVGNYASPYYDGCGEAVIAATLDNYLSITGDGTIQVQIPYSVMNTLSGNITYDVFMLLADINNDDARQILIGRLPVYSGGRNRMLTAPNSAGSGYRIVTAAGYVTVNPRDFIILLKKSPSGPSILNLPSSNSRDGLPLMIKDITGDANTNHDTIVPSGIETIDGFSGTAAIANGVALIDVDYGVKVIYPLNSGGWYTGT